MRLLTLCILVLLITSCVGTDSVNDEIATLSVSVQETTLTNNAAATTVGNQFTFEASATNDRGTTYEPTVQWNSSNTAVATIDENGRLQALSTGTTAITATARSIQSNSIMISVAETDDEVALVQIDGSRSSIRVGQQITLSARALNAAGRQVPGVAIEWESENSTIATVNPNGEVQGLARGRTDIIAHSDGVSGSYAISVGQTNGRSGTFNGLNGYRAEGNVVLRAGTNNELVLELQDNFNTANGPGLFIYLTNNPRSISGGIEIGRLRSPRGADTYDIPSGLLLTTYDHVIIFCKPFSVAFGTAALSSGS